MAFSISKNKVSRAALNGAVMLVLVTAFIGVSNGRFSEFGMYACLGLFLCLLFLHLVLRDKKFNKLQAVNVIIWMTLPWLAFLVLYAFSLGSYVAMFISLGFLIVFYLIHLMQGTLEFDEDNGD